MSDTTAVDGVLSQGSYQRLAKIIALNTRPIIVAMGSGLSSPNIKAWSGLYEALKNELEQQAGRSDADLERLSPYLEALSDADDPWSRFDIIRTAIPTEYRNIIRSEVRSSQDGDIPPVHESIWDLPLQGVISLNIDSYASRAGAKKAAGREFKIEIGLNAGRVQRILNSSHRFLYQLHGTYDDESTWIFGKAQLEYLFARPGYQSFLHTVFTQFTVIFVGISADDVAIGSPLRQLADKGIEGPEHFWITSRIDNEAVEWAQAAHVERITYPDGQHELVLEIIKRLQRVRADEPEAAPVWTGAAGTESAILSTEELAKLSTPDIRKALNRYAGWLLTHRERKDYDDFLTTYDELIDRAWYVPPNPAGYALFDYVLTGPPLRGAFGAVYRAKAPSGDVLALKLLKREIRDDLPLLHSFRRGVEAMRILAERDVRGMVAHQDRSEIPTFVTMDWVEGPNLETAKQAQMLNEWPDILAIAVQACRTVLTAHQLPEQVLHRDLRPSNIMLRGGWDPDASWDVVVLDFDLATYRGAITKSVIAEGSALGYLAPEQLVPRKGASSRNALVDAFGIGMTLYFLAGGRDPEAYMQRSAGYRRFIRDAVTTPGGHSYLATPNRIARLIEYATKDDQQERWSLTLILQELRRLHDANVGTNHALDSDLVAEEIVCHCPILADRYAWESDDTARYSVASGPDVSVHAYASDLEISARLEWADAGSNDRKALSKYLPERVDKAKSLLLAAGWDVDKAAAVSKTLRMRMSCPVSVDTDPHKLGEGLNAAIELLTFV